MSQVSNGTVDDIALCTWHRSWPSTWRVFHKRLSGQTKQDIAFIKRMKAIPPFRLDKDVTS